MAIRKCQMCGAIFPEDTPASRKYCFDCHMIRHKEQQMRQAEKRRMQALERQNNPEPKQERVYKTLRESDKAYCNKCLYRGRFTEEYLCNYFCLTGKLRGCKAGVGCDKRHIATNADNTFGYRTCKRCGAPFVGTKDANYCIECRRKVCRENAKKAHEARWKKEGTE